MKLARHFVTLGGMVSTAVLASPNGDAVKALVKAVKKGDDLTSSYGQILTPSETASVRRLAGCSPDSPLDQKDGTYTVVWHCRGRGVLGMELGVNEGAVTSVKTFVLEMRPNR